MIMPARIGGRDGVPRGPTLAYAKACARAGALHAATLAIALAGGLLMAGTPVSAQAEAPARADFTMLENGLQAVWEEDHRQPLVAIEARIKGGLRGEGRYAGTGITHFIEHMLFKGTPTRPPGTIEQEVRSYGGTINAFTSLDTTGVTLFVESKHLKAALGMLADILQHAVFDQEEFEKERAVIISEIQMNLDDPHRRIHQLFWSRHLLEHPYRHPILGYQSLLERLTVQDLSEFYAAEYQPQHIVVACVGDLDGAAFPALARDVFGGWPRGRSDPAQQLVPVEPPPATRKDASVDLPVQAAYVLLGFSSVRLVDPHTYPLDVLANVIGEGRSSRLYETLVRKRQLAHAVSAWNYTPYDPGVFAVQFRTDPEKIEPATEAILATLEEIARRGVSAGELRKAKRTISADHIFSLQTIEGKASDLASSLSTTGDPLFSRRYVERIQQVTSEQVQQAARRTCNPAEMTRVVIRPPPAVPASAPAAAVSGSIPMEKHALNNGATVIIGVDRTLPITGMVVAFRGGVRVEAEDQQGLSNLTAQLITKGTTRKGASEIALEVEALGGSLEPQSGRDGFGLVLQLLSGDLDQGLSLLHELVTQPTFPEAELAIQRELIEKQLQAQEDEIFDVGGRLLRRTLFTTHPYRFSPLGERQTVHRLTREACVAFAKRWMVPSNMVIAVVGDVEPADVLKRLEASFGRMPSQGAPWPASLPEDRLGGVREASRAMDKEQAVIMLGFHGSTHTAPDRHAVDVMTAVLSGMAGRLFQSVREAQGLSYTLGAVHVPGWDPGYLMVYAATRPEERDNVLQVLDEQLRETVSGGFRQEEVERAKQYLIGLHRMDLQHLVGLAKRAAFDELYGLGFDAWKSYEDQINAVTPALASEAARRYLGVEERAQVIVSPDGHAR